VEGRRVGHHDRWDRGLLRSRSQSRRGSGDRGGTLERCREVARRRLEAIWRRVPSDGSGDGRYGKSFLHQLESVCSHVAAVLRGGRRSSCEAVAPGGQTLEHDEKSKLEGARNDEEGRKDEADDGNGG
jgi:hypothetical protein